MDAVQRTCNGQRIAKMLRAAQKQGTNGNRNKTNNGKTWEELIYKLDYNKFPALGQEKQKSTGKFIKICFENPLLNIHDAHPVQIGQILKQYFPGHTEQRKSKNCITLKTRDKKQFEIVKSLRDDVVVGLNGQEKKIVFEEIVARNQCKGVVFEPSWKQMSEAEIKAELISEGHEVKEVKQMKKRLSDNTEVKTNCCIITFDTEELPERVKMCGVSYRIRDYFPSPLVCGKCQKIGHIRTKCRSEVEICRKCGNTQEDEHMCPPPNCPNCPNDDNKHAPNSPNCPKYEFEKMVIQHKVKNKISYGKAREECTQLLMNENSKWIENTDTIQVQEQPKVAPNVVNTDDIGERIAARTRDLEAARQQRMELEKLEQELEQELKRVTDLLDKTEGLKRKISIKHQQLADETAKKPRTSTIEVSLVAPKGANQLNDKQFRTIFNLLSQNDKDAVTKILDEHKLKDEVIKWFDNNGTLTPVSLKIPN